MQIVTPSDAFAVTSHNQTPLRAVQPTADSRIGSSTPGALGTAPPGGGKAGMESLRFDLAFGLRRLRRRWTTSVLVIVILALGLGAFTTIESVVDHILVRGLAYPEADRLVTVRRLFPDYRSDPVLSRMWDRVSFGFPEFVDIRDAQHSFDDVGAMVHTQEILKTAVGSEPVSTIDATASFMRLLGARTILGRSLTDAEQGQSAPRVAVLTYPSWVNRFASDSSVIGRHIIIGSQSFTIIGVLSPRFSFSTEYGDVSAELWLPAGFHEWDAVRNNRSFSIIARLHRGVSLQSAQSEMTMLIQRTWTGTGKSARTEAHLTPLLDEATKSARPALLLMLGGAILLLLVATANVGTLLLGEAAARDGEFATRVALGASRQRVARQLLTENLVLAFAGAALGVGLGAIAIRFLAATAPARIPRLAEITIDSRVVLTAVAVSVLTSVLFGLAPMWTLIRASSLAPSRLAPARIVSGRTRMARVSVAMQAAITALLLITSALLLRTFEGIERVDPGFNPNGLLVVGTWLPPERYPTGDSQWEFEQRAMNELRAIPGVASVAVGSFIPFADGPATTSIQAEHTRDATVDVEAGFRTISPDFIPTIGLRIVEGRAFTRSDLTTPGLAIVNKTFAHRFWPGESAVGQRLIVDKHERQIVGVVEDVKHVRMDEEPLPTFYMPPDEWARKYGFSLLVRTDVVSAATVRAIRERIAALDAGVALRAVTPMTDLISKARVDHRFRATVMSFFAVVALILACIGMYSVAATVVARRRREIALRSALGAPGAVLGHDVMREVVRSTGVGATLGAAIALLLSPVVARFLFGVTATDAVTYAGVVAALIAASFLATLAPAISAARIDPADVLRNE